MGVFTTIYWRTFKLLTINNLTMPQGFPNAMFAGKSTNSYELNKNCYYCTVSALLNVTVEELIQKVEIMQQDRAEIEEIEALFAEAGVQVSSESGLSKEDVIHFLRNNIQDSHSVGIGFTCPDGNKHMIVLTLDSGYVAGEYPGLKCVDYQTNPPTVSGFPPANAKEPYTLIYLT